MNATPKLQSHINPESELIGAHARQKEWRGLNLQAWMPPLIEEERAPKQGRNPKPEAVKLRVTALEREKRRRDGRWMRRRTLVDLYTEFSRSRWKRPLSFDCKLNRVWGAILKWRNTWRAETEQVQRVSSCRLQLYSLSDLCSCKQGLWALWRLL